MTVVDLTTLVKLNDANHINETEPKSKLDWALDMGARGFKVFPLLENLKTPPRGSRHVEDSTSDPEKIRAMWLCPVTGSEADFNIGILTGEGLIVADLDVKGEKRGIESFEGLGLSWDSFVVSTPSGGRHVYFSTSVEFANGADLLGPGSGLDARGFHGYVCGPGSTLAAGAYTVISDLPIAPAPEAFTSLLKTPGASGRQPGEIADDSPEALAQGEHFLSHSAPLAIEGEGGNALTFRVAAKLTRNLGLSEDAALDLLLEHWNPRCSPPWEAEELERLVVNSAKYGTSAMGIDTLESTFGEIDLSDIDVPDDGDAEDDDTDNRTPFRFRNLVSADDMVCRPWIYAPLLMRGQVTQLTSSGAGGKSSYILALAIHGALGKPFMGHALHDGAFKSVIYNAEDDKHEQTRRFRAICDHYEIDADEASEGVMLLGKDDFRMKLEGGRICTGVKLATGKDATRNHIMIGKLVKLCAAEEIRMLSLDPLVKLHDVPENDNGAMDSVMEIVREIAIDADVAVLLAHHVSKPGQGRVAGDVNAGRGASAIANSARINLMLSGMNAAEAKVYGISDDERPRYSRLDDSKANMSLRRGGATWIKMHSRDVYGKDRRGNLKADSIGVPALCDLAAAATSANLPDEDVNAKFLKFLARCLFRSERVNTNTRAANYAPRVFASYPDADGIDKECFARAMECLLADGRIEIVKTGKGANERASLTLSASAAAKVSDPSAGLAAFQLPAGSLPS